MDPLNQSQKMSAKVGKDDNFEAGSPAALWSCLIVFRGDPPPENFEQLTFGENIYWTDGFKVHGPTDLLFFKNGCNTHTNGSTTLVLSSDHLTFH